MARTVRVREIRHLRGSRRESWRWGNLRIMARADFGPASLPADLPTPAGRPRSMRTRSTPARRYPGADPGPQNGRHRSGASKANLYPTRFAGE